MRASAERASLQNFPISHSKTAISFNILFGTSNTLSQKHIFRSQSIHLHIHTINAVGYYLWYGVVYKRQYTDKTLTLRKSMYIYASECERASLENCPIFTL